MELFYIILFIVFTECEFIKKRKIISEMNLINFYLNLNREIKNNISFCFILYKLSIYFPCLKYNYWIISLYYFIDDWPPDFCSWSKIIWNKKSFSLAAANGWEDNLPIHQWQSFFFFFFILLENKSEKYSMSLNADAKIR